MKKVLVIDDNIENQKAAINQLNDLCDLIVLGTFEGAMNALNNVVFDAVLTDIMLPTGYAGQNVKLDANELIPSGLALALHAAGNNIPICMVTDLDGHHREPISIAVSRLELLNGNIRCHRQGHVKDWRCALEKIVDTSLFLEKKEEKFFEGTMVFCEHEVSIPSMKQIYPDAQVLILDNASVKMFLESKPKTVVITSDFQEEGLELLHKVLSLVQVNQNCLVATMLLLPTGLHKKVVEITNSLQTDYRFEIVDIVSLFL